MGTAQSWGPRDRGSRKLSFTVVQWEPRPPGPHYPSSCAGLPTLAPPCKSSHIPPGNRKPQLQPRLQTAPPSGQGVWEERPEARGQRSALFLPEVVRDGGGGGVGQGRALDSHSTCGWIPSSIRVLGSHCQPLAGSECVSLASFWFEVLSCGFAYMSVCVCLSGCSAWGPTDKSVGVVICDNVWFTGLTRALCPPMSVTWCDSLCPRSVHFPLLTCLSFLRLGHQWVPFGKWICLSYSPAQNSSVTSCDPRFGILA